MLHSIMISNQIWGGVGGEMLDHYKYNFKRKEHHIPSCVIGQSLSGRPRMHYELCYTAEGCGMTHHLGLCRHALVFIQEKKSLLESFLQAISGRGRY